MRIAYNILFVIFFWLSAPYYFVKMWRRGNWRDGMGQRFGRYTPEFKAALAGGPVLWLHAVSVGETGVCLQLLGQLEPRLPGWRFAVSTTTSTGMGELQRRLPAHIARFYYPANLSGVVRRALVAIRPRALILVESELWPNLLWQVQDRGTPVFLVNARVSDRSLRGYRRFGFLFRPIFAKFRGVGCQSAAEAGRLAELGFPAGALRVTGNLKFDAAAPGGRTGPDVPGLLRQIGVSSNARLLVAGSTHAGEEALLAEMLPRLRRQFPDLFLVLVPRHFERAGSVGQELDARGVKFIRRSDITPETRLPSGQVQCLLVNSTGELKSFYEQASLVFVGKSLTARGGQNPIEPAALAKAMVFGPNMQNFTSVVRSLLAARGAIQVRTPAELEQALAQLLADDALRTSLGGRARQVVQDNLGATRRTVEMILQAGAGIFSEGPEDEVAGPVKRRADL
jgi:3-deoxy-D-manno-octulosonic-acid transferase